MSYLIKSKMTRKKNSVCHVCNTHKKQMAVCSANRCSISYCFDCIKSKYDQKFQGTKYVKNCWVCYSCGKSCKCDICYGVIPTKRRRNGYQVDCDRSKKIEQKLMEKQKDKDNKIQIKNQEIKVKSELDSDVLSIKAQIQHISDHNQGQKNQICNFSTNSLFVPSFQTYNSQSLVNQQFGQMQYIFFYF